MLERQHTVGVAVDELGVRNRLRLVRDGIEHLDRVLVFHRHDRRLRGVAAGSEPGRVGRLRVLERRGVRPARREPHPLEAPGDARDEHRAVAVLGVEDLALGVPGEPDRERHPVHLVAVAVLGDERGVRLEAPAERVGDPGRDVLREPVRGELDVGAVVGLFHLRDERLAVAVRLLGRDVRLGDVERLGALRGREIALVRAHLHRAGVVAARDPPAAVAGPPRDLDRDGDLRRAERPADDPREAAVHPDVVLVDLLGLDAPLDVRGVDVDAERLRDLVDGDVGVIARPHVSPRVAAVDRSTARAHEHLDPVGGVDEFEVREVTIVTQQRVPAGRLAGQRLAALRNGVATPGTELPRLAHADAYGSGAVKHPEPRSEPDRPSEIVFRPDRERKV